ncbi:hypothetical protein SERLADRAFT_404664 [Serpula lacrymans var. lacrymans S7.9]|uniref:non-specific serine/threonine protein kinase n=1 Tax=Serpula lacrymans var. lacrymans (strain S7.9) TaxID=578457 RepID=F8NE10_SERL9|nr:uncharacterized protein SERLADRAFT_404664 [Serpula lacrymans var. lacrymans S7.9]EGO30538.1 hypothetical protein SERLADRAFT_404664 [Serpula lacrymans var. lacrymans S7.9]
MEYLNSGDCAALIKTLGFLPEEWTKNYIAEVVHGLKYLHQCGVVHRDLKPDFLVVKPLRYSMAPKSKKITNKTSKINTVASHISKENHGKQGSHSNPQQGKYICKPKGSPGRSFPKGYNIQEAMKLGQKKRQYNTFSAVARQLSWKYLDITATLQNQDQFVLNMVLSLRFPSNWLMHDLNGRFLCNHVQYLKKQEIETTASDNGDEFNGYDLDGLAEVLNRNEDGNSMDEDEPQDEEITRKERSLVPAGSQKPMAYKEPATIVQKSKQKTHTIGEKRKAEKIDNEPPSPVIGRWKCHHVIESDNEDEDLGINNLASQSSVRVPDDLTATTVSKKKVKDSDDAVQYIVPANPPQELVNKFSKYGELKCTRKSNTTGFLQLKLELCGDIKRAQDQQYHICLCTYQNWPLVTLSQKKQVGNVVYKYLLDNLEAVGLGCDFKKLASVPTLQPLSLSLFTHYFLVPFVACTGQNIHPYEGENDKQLDKISRAEFDIMMKEHTEIISMRRKELEDIAEDCFLEEATKEKTRTTPQGSDTAKLSKVKPKKAEPLTKKPKFASKAKTTKKKSNIPGPPIADPSKFSGALALKLADDIIPPKLRLHKKI